MASRGLAGRQRGFSMMRRLVLIALTFAPHLCGVDAVSAEELLRAEGNILRWEPPASGARTLITYAVLTGPYSVPGDRRILSKENCAAMRSFADIIATSP